MSYYLMFGSSSLLFTVIPVLVAGIILFVLIKGISQWNKNSNSPRLTVECVITAKRTETSHQQMPVGSDASGAHGFHTATSSSYYVTFQVESGDRIELAVSGREYGQLCEGDQGKMTFQGTRYLGFERKIEGDFE